MWLKKHKEIPSISICIPVYGTEKVLSRCLESIVEQDFSNLEVIVVDDASVGTDENGYSCKKIVKNVLGKAKIPYSYISHNVNLGIAETRRDCVTWSNGKYIFFFDSDDFLENPHFLSVLYETAEKEGADIVNSRALCYSTNPVKMGPVLKVQQQKMDVIVIGPISGNRSVFDSFLVEKKHLGYLWAKLIRRDLLVKAFEQIPCTFCTMGEDLLIYFFVSLFARKYYGIEEKCYRYSVDEGVSSEQTIRDMDRWYKVCSASSVFTVIFGYIQEHYDDFTVTERNAARRIGNGFLLNNLKQLKMRVVPELQEEAYKLLCEMWGTEYVHAIEKAAEEICRNDGASSRTFCTEESQENV